jgi:putative transposase
VETNPCRAGLVERPEQYRWSSAAAHLLGEKDRSGVLDMQYWERAGGAQTWVELHGFPENPGQIQAFRKCTYAGRPFGDEAFVEEMERRFQRKWLRREKEAVELAKSA